MINSHASRMWSACTVTRHTCFVSYTLTRFFRLCLSYLLFTCLYIPRVHLKNYALVTPRSDTPSEKGFTSKCGYSRQTCRVSRNDVYYSWCYGIHILVYPFWGREEINSSRVSCGYIFNVIGFSSKKPVLSVHIAHVTIRGIIAFHDFTPLCKVLVPARALFFMVR